MIRYRFCACLASALGITLALLMLAAEAYAQTAPPVLEYQIDFRPLINEVVWPLIVAIVTAIVGILARKVLSWLNLSEDRMVREYLDVALANGLELARQRLGNVPLGATTQHQLVAEASNYVIGRVPDALKRFGIDQDGLRRLIEARVASTESLVIPPRNTAN